MVDESALVQGAIEVCDRVFVATALVGKHCPIDRRRREVGFELKGVGVVAHGLWPAVECLFDPRAIV